MRTLNSRHQGIGRLAFRRRRAASLVTVGTALATIIMLSVLTAPSLQPWRPKPYHTGCDHVRHQLQQQADTYYLDHQKWPDRNLDVLAGEDYLGEPVIACPTSGVRYQMFGTVVACPIHETARTQ